MSEIRGTGPLSLPPQVGPLNRESLSESRNTPDLPAQTQAASETPGQQNIVQTQQHNTSELEATTVAFAPITRLGSSLESALNHPIEDYDQLSSGAQRQLSTLAENLNFPNGRTLVHALRNLPPESRQAWIRSLPASANNHTTEPMHAAASRLAELAHTEVNAIFESLESPEPRFNPAGVDADTEWDAPGYLSILNAFTEMKDSMPDHLLREMTSRNEQGMTFVRRHQPEATRNSNRFLEVLSNSMKIAHTNTEDTLYIYDAALSMNPQDVMKNDQVQNYIQNLASDHPDREHVRSFQDLLNASLPEERHIETNGRMGAETWAALAEFDTQQALKQALDVVKDDPRLNPQERSQWIKRIQTQQANIASEGLVPDPDEFDWKGAANTALRATVPGLLAFDAAKRWLSDEPEAPPETNHSRAQDLLNELGSQQSPLNRNSRKRLHDALEVVNRGTSQTQLQPEQLELLISNWFGIIDSGEQLDFTEQVVNHEMGHILQEQKNAEGNTWLDSWQNISFAEHEQANQAEFMGATLGTNVDGGFASDYARVNAEEDFAESFRTFTRKPEELLKQNPLKFLFMAGATGSYEGREPELVQLMRDQGYSDGEIQNSVRSLRGERSEHYTQKTQQIAQSVMDWVDRAVSGGLVAVASGGEGIGSKLGFNDWVARTASGYAADMTADMDHDFDLSVSSMLGGMEEALNMDNTRVVHPRQDGYVMDWLRQQHEIVNGPNTTPHQQKSAQENITRFNSEGLAVFPEGISKYFSSEVQERYQTPERRAVEAVMSGLAATAGILESYGQAVDQATQHGNSNDAARVEQQAIREMSKVHEGLQSLREGNVENFARRLLGEGMYEALPPEARSLLSDPRMVDLFSGDSGNVNVSGDVIQRSLDRVLSERHNAVKSAQAALSHGTGAALTQLQNILEERAGTIQLKENPLASRIAVMAIQRLVQDVATSQGQSRNCSPEDARQIIDTLLGDLNHQKTDQSPAPQTQSQAPIRTVPMDTIGDLLAQQLIFDDSTQGSRM